MPNEHLDLTHYRKAIEDLRQGGSSEFELNLTCWLGERAHRLVAEIDRLRAELTRLENDDLMAARVRREENERLRAELTGRDEALASHRRELAALKADYEALEARAEPPRPTMPDRETLGRIVREEWVRWAARQPNPKASWLVPWEDLPEADREADRMIGETVAAFVAGTQAGPPRPAAIVLRCRRCGQTSPEDSSQWGTGEALGFPGLRCRPCWEDGYSVVPEPARAAEGEGGHDAG